MAGHLEKKRDEFGYWKFRLKRIVDEEKEQYEQRYEGSIKGREKCEDFQDFMSLDNGSSSANEALPKDILKLVGLKKPPALEDKKEDEDEDVEDKGDRKSCRGSDSQKPRQVKDIGKQADQLSVTGNKEQVKNNVKKMRDLVMQQKDKLQTLRNNVNVTKLNKSIMVHEEKLQSKMDEILDGLNPKSTMEECKKSLLSAARVIKEARVHESMLKEAKESWAHQ